MFHRRFPRQNSQMAQSTTPTSRHGHLNAARALLCLRAMRLWPAILTVLLAAAPAVAERPPHALSVADITTQLAPVSQDIERCFLDRASATGGKLDLVLTVTRKGQIESLVVRTSGLAPKVAKQIDGCVRALVEPVSFPARRTFTTATIPFLFHKTTAPGAGPQLSCWNAAGCPQS
jgi:hypothetical protein